MNYGKYNSLQSNYKVFQPCNTDYTIYFCHGERSGKGGVEWRECVLISHFYPFYTRVTPWTLTLDIDTLHASTMRHITCFFFLLHTIIQIQLDKLPVTAPAWLPALSKISVQILFAPGGRKIPKFMNDQEGSENSADWKNGGRNEQTVQQTGGRKIFTFCS